LKLPLARREDAGRVVRVVDDLGGIEDLLGHEPRVPVGGPALVHDLRLHLRDASRAASSRTISRMSLSQRSSGALSIKEPEDVALAVARGNFLAFSFSLVDLLALLLEVLLGV